MNIWLPSNLSASLVSGNIKILGKQNSLYSSGPSMVRTVLVLDYKSFFNTVCIYGHANNASC